MRGNPQRGEALARVRGKIFLHKPFVEAHDDLQILQPFRSHGQIGIVELAGRRVGEVGEPDLVRHVATLRGARAEQHDGEDRMDPRLSGPEMHGAQFPPCGGMPGAMSGMPVENARFHASSLTGSKRGFASGSKRIG